MKNHLWQLSVITSIEAEDAVVALLEELLGQTPVAYTDAQSQTAAVSVYCSKLPRPKGGLRTGLRMGLRQIKDCGLAVGKGKVSLRRVRPQDWAESWKKHFRPINIGRALLIKPSWSRRRPRIGQQVVVLDPGLCFGTGRHPTTAFCLEQLVGCRRADRPQSMLDIGTGSGILAIAAAKLGYHPVQAVDMDPTAVRVTKANLLQNSVRKQVHLVRKDLTRLPRRTDAKFDVICANLTDDLLIEQADRIVNRLQTGGTLIVAGVLNSQFSRVRRIYAEAGLKLVATRQDQEWQSARFAFKP